MTIIELSGIQMFTVLGLATKLINLFHNLITTWSNYKLNNVIELVQVIDKPLEKILKKYFPSDRHPVAVVRIR